MSIWIYFPLSWAVLLCTVAQSIAAPEPTWKVKLGPWGSLVARTVYLEPPENILSLVSKPSSETRWFFEQSTPGAVRSILNSAGVAAETIESLMKPNKLSVSGNNVVILPDIEDLIAFSVESRSILYNLLAKNSANEYQRDPVFIFGRDVDDWLSESNFTPAQAELFRKLTWKRGEALVFSDIQALLKLSKTSDEIASVFRAVTRVRSLLVELELPMEINRTTFVEYWRAGSLNEERVPFLTAIGRRRSQQQIDISQFLPVLVRRRVYTFPTAALGLKGRLPDCHWTSLNFFEEEPNDTFLDSAKASQYLVSKYTVVDPPYKLGDILCFLDKGEGLHTCVQIADDIVFTKNGESILAPWTFMQLKDLEEIYRRSPDTRIQGYRLNK